LFLDDEGQRVLQARSDECAVTVDELAGEGAIDRRRYER
jgi:hypothetical protein